jgi:hypothetical protein
MLRSALAVEAVTPIYPEDLRPDAERSPEELERDEAWRRFRDRPRSVQKQ